MSGEMGNLVVKVDVKKNVEMTVLDDKGGEESYLY
jgi:hypothetical protein